MHPSANEKKREIAKEDTTMDMRNVTYTGKEIVTGLEIRLLCVHDTQEPAHCSPLVHCAH